MAGPLGALSVGPTTSTTEVELDDDGGAPGGALPMGPAAATTKDEKDVDGRPSGGATGGSGSIHHQG
jgi:hypothetical protein